MPIALWGRWLPLAAGRSWSRPAGAVPPRRRSFPPGGGCSVAEGGAGHGAALGVVQGRVPWRCRRAERGCFSPSAVRSRGAATATAGAPRCCRPGGTGCARSGRPATLLVSGRRWLTGCCAGTTPSTRPARPARSPAPPAGSSAAASTSRVRSPRARRPRFFQPKNTVNRKPTQVGTLPASLRAEAESTAGPAPTGVFLPAVFFGWKKRGFCLGSAGRKCARGVARCWEVGGNTKSGITLAKLFTLVLFPHWLFIAFVETLPQPKRLPQVQAGRTQLKACRRAGMWHPQHRAGRDSSTSPKGPREWQEDVLRELQVRFQEKVLHAEGGVA